MAGSPDQIETNEIPDWVKAGREREHIGLNDEAFEPWKIYMPEAARTRGLQTIGRMLGLPEKAFNPYRWGDAAGSWVNRGAHIRDAMTWADDDKIYRLIDGVEPTDARAIVVKRIKGESGEDLQKRNREFLEKVGKDLANEFETVGKAIDAVLRMGEERGKYGRSGGQEFTFIRTPYSEQFGADDAETLFGLPALLTGTITDPNGVQKELTPEEIDKYLESKERTNNDPTGVNIDKAARCYFVNAISEDPAEMMKSINSIDLTEISDIKEVDLNNYRILREQERTNSLDDQAKQVLFKIRKRYWLRLMGIRGDEMEKKWIGDVTKLTSKKERRERTYQLEADRGERGTLLLDANFFSLPRQKVQLGDLRNSVTTIIGGDSTARTIAEMFHWNAGIAERWGDATFETDNDFMVEGPPNIAEAVTQMRFRQWILYKGRGAGPAYDFKNKRARYGALAVSRLEHTMTTERASTRAPVFIVRRKTDKGIQELKVAEYITGKDTEGNDIKQYKVVKKNEPIGHWLSLGENDELISLNKSLFEQWQAGKRLGELPWEQASTYFTRDHLLRLFFFTREKTGIKHILTNDTWRLEELSGYFIEQFKVGLKVIIKDQVIENDPLWQKVLDKTTDEEWAYSSIEEKDRDIEWVKEARELNTSAIPSKKQKSMGVTEPMIERAKKDPAKRRQRIKDYIYTEWWNGIKTLKHYPVWREERPISRKVKGVRSSDDKKLRVTVESKEANNLQMVEEEALLHGIVLPGTRLTKELRLVDQEEI